MKKMAEVTIEMECGGRIVTYLPCKGEKDLLKKLKKRDKGEWFDFGHFRVNDAAVMYAGYVMRSVH